MARGVSDFFPELHVSAEDRMEEVEGRCLSALEA